MPLDSVCISALKTELETRILGAKIDKVQQPERDMLLLSLRGNGENMRLLLAAGTGNARVHLTTAGFENPAEPPMFCMLMRKHLVGARIVGIRQPDHERMLILDLDTYDELGVNARKQLIVEMIGRSSNTILVGEDGRIIDCMRRVDFAGDPMRRMLPGMIYRLPPKQNKPDLWGLSPDERSRLTAEFSGEMLMDKWLLNTFSGLSPLICRELAFRCGEDASVLDAQLAALCETVDAGELTPIMLVKDGKPQDFSFLSIGQYGPSVTLERFESFSALLDAFYSRRDRDRQQQHRSHELMRSVKTARDRLARKLVAQQTELKRTETREDVRHRAELITANLYRLKKGERSFSCEDYYDPECPTIQIELDPLKTPQQNAATLYKEYNKLKTAESYLRALVGQTEQQLDYLNSVLDVISRSESEKDLGDVRKELIQTGYLRRQKNSKPERGRAQQPLRFLSDDGFEILVGRSNLQNDELTTKTARRTDYWLHTQKVHGSHVIVRCDGIEPSELALQQAASIAAYYSQGRDSGRIPVDYTMVRFVRKPSGAMPGKVIYTNYNTLMADSDGATLEQLNKK